MFKRSLKYFFSFHLLLILTVTIWIAWVYLRDPLQAIDKGVSVLNIASYQETNEQIVSQKRQYIDYHLQAESGENISVYCSFPDSIPVSGLPVMVIMGGLHIGRQNFSFIQSPGNNILIIYDYPYSPEYWYEGTALTEIPKIRNAVLDVPSRLVWLLNWIRKQAWADSSRISVLGYSFGALFIPAVYRLAKSHELSLEAGIICYGGADIRRMLYTNLKKNHEPARILLSYFAATAINAVEPAHHLPYLQNEFLLINGNKDRQIPEESWLLLHRLTPDPKTILILDEGHMHPDKPALTQKLVKMSQDWLISKGIINP